MRTARMAVTVPLTVPLHPHRRCAAQMKIQKMKPTQMVVTVPLTVPLPVPLHPRRIWRRSARRR
eukprot:4111774-Pyramimonas_sp.AAC.1